MPDIEKSENNTENEKKYSTACGKEVFVTAETMNHLKAHPDVVEYLTEAISRANIPNGSTIYRETVDMGRTVGISALIETDRISLNDETYFAKRIEREYPVRIILNVVGQPTAKVTLKVVFDEMENKFLLQTAWIGPDAPPLPYNVPGDLGGELEKSLGFWCSHALAYDPKVMGKPFKTSWNFILNKEK